MRQSILIIFAGILPVTAFACAAGPDDIPGVRNTEEKDAKIEICECGERYGTIRARVVRYKCGE
jgi:hypothetical protein